MNADLNEAEKRLLEAVKTGGSVSFLSEMPFSEQMNASNAWGENRTIRANVLRSILLENINNIKINEGVIILGAKIKGKLDLDNVDFKFPLSLCYCRVDDEFSIKGGIFSEINLKGSNFYSKIDARNIDVKRNLSFVDGFYCEGEILMMDAEIGGIFSATGGVINSATEFALSCDRMTAARGIFFGKGFSASGGVRFDGANIRGDIACEDIYLDGRLQPAISADGAHIAGSIILVEKCRVNGEIRLSGAEIQGDLSCPGCIIGSTNGRSISADGVKIGGDVHLNEKFKSIGEIRFVGSKISGGLNLNSAVIFSSNGIAISADGIKIDGDLNLCDGFDATGEVRLIGSSVMGDLNCTDGRFRTLKRVSILATRATIRGAVHLDNGFVSVGEVRFQGSHVEGDFWCVKALMKSFDLDPDEPPSIAFTFERSTIGGLFVLKYSKIYGLMSLAYSKISRIFDDEGSWPSKGLLILDGLEYIGFAYEATRCVEVRLSWLRRQVNYVSQPYEQLAAVYRREGYLGQAREIAIFSQIDLRESGHLGPIEARWNRFLEVSIGFGYKPWRAIFCGLFFLIWGWVWFSWGYELGLMVPSETGLSQLTSDVGANENYPPFIGIIYSLDTFLPVVDLHQEKYWHPKAIMDRGWLLWAYLWFHILMGWVFTSIFVLAFTGMFNKK